MKSICLLLAAAATIALAIAAPVSGALAGTHPSARAPAPAPIAVTPPRIVVPNKTVQLPPKPTGGTNNSPKKVTTLEISCGNTF